MRIIGLDIHRAFAEAVAWDDGRLNRLGRIDMRRHLLEAFARELTNEDVVVVEATGNAAAVAAVITPHVKKVVIANPKQVRIIAHAKIKTDTIDASVLAQLYASGFLPEVWIPDQPTQALRRQAPQMRRDDEGCAAGLSPRALLFAARSPARERKIARIRQESICRSHPWSRDAWAWSTDDRYR